MNGHAVQILRDTGCDNTLVHSSLVPVKDYIKDEMLTVILADSTVKCIPVAKVELECDMVYGEYCVGVMENLAEDVLLGNDLHADAEHNALRCVTRRQAQIQSEAEDKAAKLMSESGIQPKAISLPGDTEPQAVEPFVADCGGKERVKTHCLPQEDQEVQDSAKQGETDLDLEAGLAIQGETPKVAEVSTDRLSLQEVYDVDRNRLIALKQSDTTLSDIRKIALTDVNAAKERVCFYVKDKILYRQWRPSKKGQPLSEEDELDGTLHQLVLPVCCRAGVMQIAHEIPLSGDLGIEKTKNRILMKTKKKS